MRITLIIAMIFTLSTSSIAGTIKKTGAAVGVVKSTRFGTAVEVSRVVEVIKLVSAPNIQVNVAVRDLGGSTDVSPTQELFFTLYSKGEMFSTDATFNLGAIYDFKSARRISGGVYEILVGGIDFETSMPKNKLLLIDAQKAIDAILKVRCAHFDCPASDEFETSIIVTEK